MLQRRARAVAEPRGEGDGADKWGRAVSGCGREEGAAAGLAAVLGRRLAGRARLGAGGGRKQRSWAGAEEWASRPKELGHGPKIKKGGKNGFFSFLFLLFSKSLFKFKFQFFLKSLTNSKHSQNDMQQHVCIKKFLTLFLNFNSTKFIISLSFNAHIFA